MAKRQIPSTAAEVRRKPYEPRGPFDEMVRGPLARDLGSSRIGELKETDYPRKVGMGDLQTSENRKALAQKYSQKMLKAGLGRKGKQKEA